VSNHTNGPWEFIATTYSDGSPCYAIRSSNLGYIVAYALGQTDAEALANAQRIAKVMTEANQKGTA